MKDSTPWIVAGAATVVVGTGLGGFYWYQQQRQAPPPLHPPVAAAPPMAPADAVPAPQLPAIQHPIEAAQAASEPLAGLPPVDQANGIVESALIDLLGRKPVLSFLDTDGFVRRVVASVDNLPSKHASVRLWPVQPVGGRLVVEQREDGVYLGAGNAARYEPSSASSSRSIRARRWLYTFGCTRCSSRRMKSSVIPGATSTTAWSR